MRCATVALLVLYAIKPSSGECNVRDYGAHGDNSTEDTEAIQRALDECGSRAASNSARETVVLPGPGAYLSRPIAVPSNVTLRIEPSATLVAWADIPTWPNSTWNVTCHVTPYQDPHPVEVPQKGNFIHVGDTTGVEITGGGVIDGQGWRWWPLRKKGEYWHNCRPRMLAGDHVVNFAASNITIRNSPMYNVALGNVDNVRFVNVFIDSNPGYGYNDAPNTDGFNLHGKNIYIGQSRVRNGDDCVPLNPETSNVLVEDLECSQGNGIVPIIWSRPGTVSNVTFRRVRLTNVSQAITVKSLPTYVGTVRDVLWEDITISNVGKAIHFDAYNQLASQGSGSSAPNLMQLYNVTVRNVVIQGADTVGEINCGSGSSACTGLTFENITATDYKHGWTCSNAYGNAKQCEPKPCLQQ